tara:strand:+ start:608 stop:1252 length:645 start_codon:yes stop_codon:yes gene_type:complete
MKKILLLALVFIFLVGCQQEPLVCDSIVSVGDKFSLDGVNLQYLEVNAASLELEHRAPVNARFKNLDTNEIIESEVIIYSDVEGSSTPYFSIRVDRESYLFFSAESFIFGSNSGPDLPDWDLKYKCLKPCRDSDAGDFNENDPNNNNVKGITTGFTFDRDHPHGTTVAKEDYCPDDRPNSVVESYCIRSTNMVSTIVAECGEGRICQAGACVLG